MLASDRDQKVDGKSPRRIPCGTPNAMVVVGSRSLPSNNQAANHEFRSMAPVLSPPAQTLLSAAALLTAVSLVVASPAATMAAKLPKPRVTTLQFYMHDRPGDTAVRVAPATPLNFSGRSPGDWVAAMFGSVYVMDNPLTAAPGANSTVVGRAQGIYAMASREDEFSLLMVLTYAFVRGPFNGSSFSVLGRNPVGQAVREMPIVGGTGAFRLARGYCLARTQAADGMDAVVGYNATIIHH